MKISVFLENSEIDQFNKNPGEKISTRVTELIASKKITGNDIAVVLLAENDYPVDFYFAQDGKVAINPNYEFSDRSYSKWSCKGKCGLGYSFNRVLEIRFYNVARIVESWKGVSANYHSLMYINSITDKSDGRGRVAEMWFPLREDIKRLLEKKGGVLVAQGVEYDVKKLKMLGRTGLVQGMYGYDLVEQKNLQKGKAEQVGGSLKVKGEEKTLISNIYSEGNQELATVGKVAGLKNLFELRAKQDEKGVRTRRRESVGV